MKIKHCQFVSTRQAIVVFIGIYILLLLLLHHRHLLRQSTVRSQGDACGKCVVLCYDHFGCDCEPLPLIPLRLNVQYAIALEKRSSCDMFLL